MLFFVTQIYEKTYNYTISSLARDVDKHKY